MPSSQPENQLDNGREELKLKSQLINALQVFDLLPYEQDSKYGSGKANKEDYWRICNKAIDQYTQSKLKAFAGEVEHKLGLADGDGEVHVSHVCPQDSIPCAKFAQRGATRHHQRQSLEAIKEKAGIE